MNDFGPENGFPARGPAERPGPASPLRFAHAHLRGRYWLAGLLGLAIGIPAALFAYMTTPPTYSSSGIVRIAPTGNRILYQNDENALLPLFDAFVSTQATLISSRRVLDKAVGDPRLREVGWPSGIDGANALSRRLAVHAPRRSETITVAVSHVQPEKAQAAVNAVLRAYEELAQEATGERMTEKEQLLTQRSTTLRKDLDTIREQIMQRAQEFGTDDIGQLHDAKVKELSEIQRRVDQLDIQEAQLRGAGDAADAEAYAAQLHRAQLAATDPMLAQLLREEQAIQSQIEASARLGPGHRTMKDLSSRLESIRLRITERVAALTEVADALGASPGVAAPLTPAQITALREQFASMRQRVEREAMALSRARARIAGLRQQEADKLKLLEETDRTLDQLRLENSNRINPTGRVSVVQYGDLPTDPSRDRRLPMALVFGAGGLGTGAGLVFLFGLIVGGYRYIDEIEGASLPAPLLGTIPDLTAADPEQKDLAARSVHHLRNLLDIALPPGGVGRAYTLTSGASGDGKTNLVMALGMSMAVTGRRVAIVDADLIGRGLSTHLGLRDAAGLTDALACGRLNGELHQTRVDHLWAVPAGAAPGFEPEHLSSAAVERLLNELRDQFDAVIIDTGPVLGSLEANLVAPLSDGVILVISQGQKQQVVQASLDRLRRIGAKCVGVVFNRAITSDFVQSQSMSVRSRPAERPRGRDTALLAHALHE